jgi:hypothetical protein
LSKNSACGIQTAVLENEEGKTVVLPAKLIADKEILIESGPEPETTEKRDTGLIPSEFTLLRAIINIEYNFSQL